jgi:excisionase family DNA binding protein
MKTNQDPFMETLSESNAAKVIGVSRLTLQRARKRGEISYYQVGTRILYAPRHIADYLASVEKGRESANEDKLLPS